VKQGQSSTPADVLVDNLIHNLVISLLIVKLQIFPYTCFVYFFNNDFNIGKLTSATSKEKMTTNIIFADATSIN